MGEGFVTKRGRRMRPVVRRRLIAVMSNPLYDGLRQKELAVQVGVSARTLTDYLTDELMAEIHQLRAREVELGDLREVDRAMLGKARAGNVQAARLIYARVAGMKFEDDEVPTLDELEREIQKLKATGG